MKNIVVVCGGNSSERDISLITGKAIYKALKTSFNNVYCIDCKDGKDCLDKILKMSPDVVFIALHGGFGENGQLQATLELLDIRHTGCSFLSSNIAMNKFITKSILKENNIPTAEAILLKKIEQLNSVDFFPVCIKPNSEGSSVDVNFANSKEEAKKITVDLLKKHKEIIVERKINGKELTVGILFGKALPIIHVKPKNGFYDYKNKYTKGATEYIVPANLPSNITKIVQNVALGAYEAIGCDSYARIDLILENNIPYVLEINSIPGMTPTSLLPKAAAKAGIDFETLVKKIVEGAC